MCFSRFLSKHNVPVYTGVANSRKTIDNCVIHTVVSHSLSLHIVSVQPRLQCCVKTVQRNRLSAAKVPFHRPPSAFHTICVTSSHRIDEVTEKNTLPRNKIIDCYGTTYVQRQHDGNLRVANCYNPAMRHWQSQFPVDTNTWWVASSWPMTDQGSLLPPGLSGWDPTTPKPHEHNTWGPTQELITKV